MKAVSLGKQKKKSLPWRIVSGLANTALLIILALFVYLYLAFPMQMKGHSMEPAVAEKSLLLLNKIQYRFVSPKQFDVIAFQIKDSDELQIKRIIACPGDRISIKEGMIYINGTLCEQANEYSKDLIYAGTASDELIMQFIVKTADQKILVWYQRIRLWERFGLWESHFFHSIFYRELD